MSSTNTTFFAVSRRVGPSAHLEVLRGQQDAMVLHHEHFMSPALHNSSDTYHRHLSAQSIYRDELSEGQHQRAWIAKSKERKAFNGFTDYLHDYSGSFLHGRGRETIKQDKEEQLYGVTKEAFVKREFLEREETGMERRGWAAEDYCEIKRAIVEEDWANSRRFLDRSFSSTSTTAMSSVFDDESDDEYTDDSENDCSDTTKPSANSKIQIDSATQIGRRIVRSTTIATVRPQLEKPSALLSSFCYRPGDESDSDEETDSDEEEEEESSPARQRMAKFLADIVSVRSQVAIDIETDWELKVLSKKQRTRLSNRSCREHYQPLNIVSLLPHMNKNRVYTKGGKANLRFKRTHKFGSHSVEFCGRLREELLGELKREGGSKYEGGLFVAMDEGEWASLTEEDNSFDAVRKMQHLVRDSGKGDLNWLEMGDAAGKARQLKELLENRCMEAIEDAMGF